MILSFGIRKTRKPRLLRYLSPNYSCLNRAESEKVNKYQDLKNDLRQTWELEQINTILIIVCVTGLIMINLKSYSKDIPGSSSVEEIQIFAITGTVSILKGTLSQ